MWEKEGYGILGKVLLFNPLIIRPMELVTVFLWDCTVYPTGIRISLLLVESSEQGLKLRSTLTPVCDEDDLSLPLETVENSGGVVVPIDFPPWCGDSKLWFSTSELLDGLDDLELS